MKMFCLLGLLFSQFVLLQVSSESLMPVDSNDIIVNAAETIDWWEMQQTDDAPFDEFRTSRILLRFIELDEQKIHTCYEYKVIGERGDITHTDTFCYPSVIITGYRKSSTSALYNLFAAFPDVKITVTKENCPFIGDRSIIQYFSSLPRSIQPGEIIFDGCIDLKGNVKIRNLLREPNAYYLVLIRDFASWLWSAYNYWCQPEYDAWCFVGDHWVNPDLHYRTPEVFHDIVMGSINGTDIASPLLFKKPCDEGRVLFQRFVNKLWTFMPLENTIVLASEDLESNPEYVWSRIATAIGIDTKHPKLKEFTEVRYNTQGEKRKTKGATVAVAADKYTPGLYGVSKFRPMLDETRHVLNQCWYNDCLWSSLVTGHKYAACHSAENSTREFTNYVTADVALNESVFTKMTESDSPSYGANMTVYLKKYFDLQTKYMTEPRPFLQIPTIKCEENFNHTLALNKVQNTISMKLQSHGTTEKSNENVLLQRELAAKVATLPKQRMAILLLSTTKSDRDFIQNLMLHTTGFYDSVDVNVDGVVEGHIASPTPVLGPRGLEMCSNVNLFSNRKLYIGADPNSVRVIPKAGTNQYIYEFKKQTTNCDMGIATFEYVMYSVRDSLAAAWTEYQRSKGYPVGVFGDDLVHFDWAAWEAAAPTFLQNTSASVVSRNEASDSNDIIYKIAPANKLIFRIEDLRFSAGKVNLLKMVINFPQRENPNNKFVMRPDLRTGKSESNLAMEKQKTNLNCAHLLSTKKASKKESFTSRTNIDQAYASDDLLCRVKKLYENNPLSLLSLQIEHNVTCHNGISVHRNILRKCKIRYEKRQFLAVPRLPPALVSLPTMDVVNLRLMIEHATGAYTGDMETNRFVTDMFPGEQFCGQRMSVIFANAVHVTIKNVKAGPGTVSLPTHGKRKCMRGTIRGFTHALLLIRDPFMSVWREYHHQLLEEAVAAGKIEAIVKKGKVTYNTTILNSGSHLHQYPNDMKQRLLNISRYFNVEKLGVTHAYERLQQHNFESDKALIVSFEAIINAVAPVPVVHNTHNHNKEVVAQNMTAKFQPAQEVLKFAMFGEAFIERLECAFKFMEIETALLELQHMNSFFLSHQHLICAMNKQFNAVLAGNKFPTHRMYNEIHCESQ